MVQQGGRLNTNYKLEDTIMATKKQNEKKTDNWLESYCTHTEKSCASHVTNLIRSGAKIADLIEHAKKFHSKRGNGKCLTTEGSVRSHLKWLAGKGCVVSNNSGVYKVTYPHTDKKAA